ncbi:MAG: DUF4011 domain-containing protein, partial [Ferrimicrobium sp.]
LEWKDPLNGDLLHSPLVFVPVVLTRDPARESFRLGLSEGELQFNPALALKLERDAALTVPKVDLDDGLDTIFSTVDELIGERVGWSVTRGVVLARFSFQKEVMYKDLLDHSATIVEHPIVAALAGDPLSELPAFDTSFIPEDELDDRDPPEERPTVMDADSSQRQCIEAAARGMSFVMDGPPGTGKSQTITNMIAELIRLGSSVLFVSEKAAALDVVKDRLGEVGLASYVLDLRDQRRTRKAIAQELKDAMYERPRLGAESMGEFDLATLKMQREELTNYADAMGERREPIGLSVYELIGRASTLRSLPQAPVARISLGEFTPSRFAEVLGDADRVSKAWGPVDRGEYFLWRDLIADHYDAAFLQVMTDDVNRAKVALENLSDKMVMASDE